MLGESYDQTSDESPENGGDGQLAAMLNPSAQGLAARKVVGVEGLGHENKREGRTHVPGGKERKEEAVPFEGVRLRL